MAAFWVVGFVAVILSEILMAGHQRSALLAAEKADAEGMMFLKDPRLMLRALEAVLERNNTVPSAGEAYSALFFCWAGFGYAPESDPEMERIDRLREVLGAEGSAPEPAAPPERVTMAGAAPRPPRIDDPPASATRDGSRPDP
jgi:hypothetical protein